jgi:myo-inositol-1(or 4)-monophosphatase
LSDELLELARTVAFEAGTLLRERASAPHAMLGSKSSPTDAVSQTDVDAERLIRDRIGAARPRDSILGEEGGSVAGEGSVRWIVDPLDGTVNFLYGIPQFAVSIACEDDGGTLAGVVHDPLRGETFAATRTGPATLNGREIAGSGADDLATALVATGFGYEASVRARQAETLLRVLPGVRDIRRAGSAALDLGWTACGRHDGYYERGVKPWDWRAGGLICERAGLMVRELAEDGELPSGIVVAPPALVDALHELVSA